MKWLYRFFMVLGVIFFLILLGITYFVITDPFNLRPMLMSMYGSNVSEETQDVDGVPSNDAGATSDVSTANTMTDSQAQALESVGINPETVPAQFTPEQKACFVNILGQKRVDEIIAGSVPTPAEFYQAKNCL